MRINCVKGRGDINRILNGIDSFITENCLKRPSYIIMNHKTGEDILDPYRFIDVSAEGDKLFSIPVAYNEGLEDGEVDIV